MLSRNVYYGNHGEYGPYTSREYGLPDAGEVLEDFRCAKLMSVQDFVEAYNKEVVAYNQNQEKKKRRRHLPTITRNLVYKWEKHNMVPTDTERRRLIANILHIPLALFGIVAAEEIVFKPVQQATLAVVTHQAIDLLPYEETARTFWRFHHTSTAQHEWYTIAKAIQDLETYEQQLRGNSQRDVREILYSYYLLATRILKDDGVDFSRAYQYANRAVRVAKTLQTNAKNNAERIEFGWGVARAYYAQGYVKLVSGLYQKEKETNLFTINRTKLQDAITDFEEAEKEAAPGLKGNLYSELARAQGFGRRSNTDITLAQRTIEKAKNWIGVVSAEDPYAQNLLDGTAGGLTKGLHMLRTAVVLDSVGRSEEALQILQSLEGLKTGHIPSDYTRENAWMNIVWSQAAFNEKDFYTTTLKAKIALFACQDIQSAANIIIIQDIYQQLLLTTYKNQQDVKELGRLLTMQSQRALSLAMK